MKMFFLILNLFFASIACHAQESASDETVWYNGNSNITISISSHPTAVVSTAKQMLMDDLYQVTGRKVQELSANNQKASIRVVQLDKDKSQDKWLRSVGMNVDSIRSVRECFAVKALDSSLLVVGADARGTAYGILEVSRLAGVSPWIFWNDAKPQHKDRLTVSRGFQTIQSPDVAFRGIFINDEDWSLMPWSCMTFDKNKYGTISANAYREIFKTLLRLRGNMIWPGMHGATVPFYMVPGAKECADSCGIVIGTSHCEPLMRNNVGEWNEKQRGRYNFITNRNNVLDYWSERLQEVGQYENFYTIGMRGIHDGEMEGVKTRQEKVDALNAVIKDQRILLEKNIVKNKKVRAKRGYESVGQIPQAFVPYKEVLQIMEAGVDVPEDVMLMWCDDNYGYLTRLSDSIQQQRSGGGGVYYHLSYWGRPHDYLWLTTTQPGLVYNEMKQAYDHNVRRSWIVNVHDLKAASYDLELFMDLAWNVSEMSGNSLNNHLRSWLCREFDDKAGNALFPVMNDFYRLISIRKPEFMGWNQVELDKKTYARGISPVRDTEFSFTEFGNEAQRYINDYVCIREEAERIGKELIPQRLQDTYFSEVLYPVSSASYMAEKTLYAQMARQIASGNYNESRVKRSPQLEIACAKSQHAYQQIRRLTDYYNNTLGGGKWGNIMCDKPRDLYVFWAPSLPLSLTDTEVEEYLSLDRNNTDGNVQGVERTNAKSKDYIALDAKNYSSSKGTVSIIQNLGHSQNALSLPKGNSVTYDFNSPVGGDGIILLCLIPTQANDKGDIRFEVSIDGGSPQVFSLKEPFRSETWKQNVLRAQARFTMPVSLTQGQHTLTIKALDDHIILDQWMLDFKKERKFYVIPTKVEQ